MGCRTVGQASRPGLRNATLAKKQGDARGRPAESEFRIFILLRLGPGSGNMWKKVMRRAAHRWEALSQGSELGP